MKHGKLWSAVLSAAMVMGTTVPILAADMDGKLVVIHTNDIHGYYATAEESVGIAGVAALKDYYEAQGADVVLLDAGVFSQGTTLVNHSYVCKNTYFLATSQFSIKMT